MLGRCLGDEGWCKSFWPILWCEKDDLFLDRWGQVELELMLYSTERSYVIFMSNLMHKSFKI